MHTIHPQLLHDMITVERRMAELHAQRPTAPRHTRRGRPAPRLRGVATGRWFRRSRPAIPASATAA